MITCMYTPARCECGSWLEGCIFLQVMCDASRIVDGWNAALVDRHFIPLVCYIPDGARFSHEQSGCSPGDHHKYHISECSFLYGIRIDFLLSFRVAATSYSTRKINGTWKYAVLVRTPHSSLTPPKHLTANQKCHELIRHGRRKTMTVALQSRP